MNRASEKLAVAAAFALLGLIIYCIAFFISRGLGAADPRNLAETAMLYYSVITLVSFVFDERRRS